MSNTGQKPAFELKGLQDWIEEQNALASIDFVYFLLVPLTTLVLSQLPQLKEPDIVRVLSEIFIYSSVPSLLVGAYSKMIDSVTYRIRAWAIFILLFCWWCGGTMLVRLSLWLLPSLAPMVVSFLTHGVLSPIGSFVYVPFVLSISTFGLALASYPFRHIWRIFLRRAPSRKSEIERGLDILVLRQLKTGVERTWKEDLAILTIGLMFYAVFVLICWFSYSCRTG